MSATLTSWFWPPVTMAETGAKNDSFLHQRERRRIIDGTKRRVRLPGARLQAHLQQTGTAVL